MYKECRSIYELLKFTLENKDCKSLCFCPEDEFNSLQQTCMVDSAHTFNCSEDRIELDKYNWFIHRFGIESLGQHAGLFSKHMCMYFADDISDEEIMLIRGMHGSLPERDIIDLSIR